MANEFENIDFPTEIVGLMSEGYQRQNVISESLSNGIESIFVDTSGANVIVSISGPVDVNSVLYNVGSSFSLTPTIVGWNYIVLTGGPENLTASLITDNGEYKAYKNARDDSGENRILKHAIYYDGTNSYVQKYREEVGELSPGKLNVFAKLTGTVSLGDGSTIIFDNEIRDNYSSYDNTTGIFTAPYDGLFLVTSYIQASKASASNNSVDIYIDTTRVHQIYIGDSSQFNKTITICRPIEIKRGEELKLSLTVENPNIIIGPDTADWADTHFQIQELYKFDNTPFETVA